MSRGTASLRAAALAARAAGCSVIPIKADGSKAPPTSWKPFQSQIATVEEVERWFEKFPKCGFAVLGGLASGNLEWVDFEDRDLRDTVVEAAHDVGLGPLVCRIRAGYEELSPDGAHWAIRCAEIGNSTPLARRPNPDEPQKPYLLIEIRGEGGYAIVAPSNGAVHPTGKPYELVSGSFATIARITPEERLELFRLLRSFDEMPPEEVPPLRGATGPAGDRPGDTFRSTNGDLEGWRRILEPHRWVLVYQRGDVGYWRRPGKDYGISATTGHAGTDYLYVFSTSTNFPTRQAINPFGAYTILNHNGDYQRAARQLANEGFGTSQAGSSQTSHPATDSEADTQSPLDAGEEHLPTITTMAWERLQTFNDTDPRIFTFGNELTRIDEGEEGEPLPRLLTEDRLMHELARATRWDKYDERTKDRREAMPPRPVVKDMLAGRSFPLSPLRGIVQTPVFAGDGSLSMAKGYSRSARLYYAPADGFIVPPIPDRPKESELEDAVSLIVTDLLGDFPFTGAAERANAIAFVLLPYLRELVGGPTPIQLFEKPAAGTGASLLVTAAALLATGRHPGMMTEGRDEDEWRKRITAALRGSPTFVVIDNLRLPLNSAALSSVVTSTSWADRRLGVSEIIQLPVRCGWAATGNNPAMSSEIARRVVRIRMDAKTDKPWQRTEFRHGNLREWIMENRGDLVAACLTIGRAWIVAGRPPSPMEPVLGSFESWARVMGGVLHIAGVPGFLENVSELYESADTEGLTTREFLSAWWNEFHSKAVGVGNLFELASTAGIDLGAGSERSQQTKLGSYLRQLKDCQYTLDKNVVRITSAGTKQGAQQWQLITPSDDAQQPQLNLREQKQRGAKPSS